MDEYSRLPRTMDEAFGPYARSTPLEPMPPRRSERDYRYVDWALYVVLLFVIAILFIVTP